MDTSDRSMMLQIVQSAVGTKAVSRWGELACNMALDAVRTVELEDGSGRKEIDIKKYAKVEKVILPVAVWMSDWSPAPSSGLMSPGSHSLTESTNHSVNE